MTKQEIYEITKPRMILIKQYPNSQMEIDDIPTYRADYLVEYPHLFKELAWYEHRSMEEMFKIKYVRVLNYVGYYKEGAVVPVGSYKIDANAKHPRFEGFYLGNSKDHPHPCSAVQPATEEEFKNYEIYRNTPKC